MSSADNIDLESIRNPKVRDSIRKKSDADKAVKLLTSHYQITADILLASGSFE